MTHGAAALARTPDGQVVFVDDALPGERVRAQVLSRRPKYLQARAVEIIDASSHRMQPPCPYVPDCGGCQWQHASYEAQLQMKAEVLTETLARAGVSAPAAEVVAAPDPLRYRIRGEFHVIPPSSPGEGYGLGFNRRRSYDAVAVHDCLIHHRHITEALPGIARALDRAGAGSMRAIRLTTHPDRRELLWQAMSGPAPAELQMCLGEELGDYLVHQDSISLEYDGSQIDHRSGPPLMFRVDSKAFVQVNHLQAHHLYGRALDYLGDRPGRLVEGYAGLGVLSVLAGTRPDSKARPTHTSLVEAGKAASVLSRLHLRLHGVEPAEVVPRRLEDFLPRLEPGAVDSLIVDPPRAGCAPAVLAQIGRLRPQRIVYVSCDPATLARDLARLSRQGYAVEAQSLVDMFPQTYHIETVTLLLRR